MVQASKKLITIGPISITRLAIVGYLLALPCAAK